MKRIVVVSKDGFEKYELNCQDCLYTKMMTGYGVLTVTANHRILLIEYDDSTGYNVIDLSERYNVQIINE